MSVLADQTLPGFGNQPVWITLIKVVGVFAFLALLTLPPGAPLRHPETGAIIGSSPFMNSLIVSISTTLVLPRGESP